MPYWAEMWPSGVALARASREERSAGCGRWSWAAGRSPCRASSPAFRGRVLATDWSADAVAFAKRNARRSRAPIEVELASWTEPHLLESRAPWGLVLAADVLYEQRNADLLLRLLHHAWSASAAPRG